MLMTTSSTVNDSSATSLWSLNNDTSNKIYNAQLTSLVMEWGHI